MFFTILFIFILIQYSFSTLEGIFYDLRARIDWGVEHQKNIIIISLDQESNEFLGETYPYTYATHVRFLSRLLADSPHNVNYFVELAEPDSIEEEKFLERFKQEVLKFTRSSKNKHFRFGTNVDITGIEELPPEGLQDLGHSLAVLKGDKEIFSKDGVLRRAVLFSSGNESLHLWTANKYRELSGQAPLESKSIRGSYYDRMDDTIFTLFRYFDDPREDKSTIDTIPFHRVLVGNFPDGYFKNKIVLVAPKYIDKKEDFILTPFNKAGLAEAEHRTPRVNTHAQIVQSLIQNKTVLQVNKKFTDILSLLLAIYLSLIISRVQPTRGLFITVSTLMVVMLASVLMFSWFGLWIHLSHLVLSIFAVYYIWVPFKAIGEYKRRFAFQEEAKLLKQVDNLKQNFISLMSHDLKTPVAKIAGIADILKNQYEISDGQRKNIEAIIEATKELNKFITSILDLTKIESRNLTLKTTSKDLNKVVEQVVQGLEYEAKANEVTIETTLAPLYPIKLDLTLINRVISNLVENSIKYSGRNSVINISTWDDDKWVYLKIADTGVGIAEADLEYIFSKFYRVRNDASHKIKGSGLGLYLVKYFVELHGGTIKVESKMGEGTAFTVTLKNE